MTYDGGKNATFRHIVNQMPPHDVYLELFLGSGAVLRNKRPARQDIGVELDPAQCEAVRRALPSALIMQADAMEFVREFKFPAGAVGLIYADPPYLLSTRSSQRRLYAYEFCENVEHIELLTALRQVPALVMVSGYRSELYDHHLQGWRRVEWQAVKRNGEMATECLWCNFPAPLELHDWRYLGSNKDERQRMKRKKESFARKLRAMSPLERGAVLSAIREMQMLPAIRLGPGSSKQLRQMTPPRCSAV